MVLYGALDDPELRPLLKARLVARMQDASCDVTMGISCRIMSSIAFFEPPLTHGGLEDVVFFC